MKTSVKGPHSQHERRERTHEQLLEKTNAETGRMKQGMYEKTQHQEEPLSNSTEEGGTLVGKRGKEVFDGLTLYENEISLTDDQKGEMVHFMRTRVEASVNPRSPKDKPNYIHRKQCTLVTADTVEYDFKQTNKHFRNCDEFPEAATMTLARTKELMPGHAVSYNANHVNLYPDGRAEVMPHQDNETGMNDHLPVFSYTFLEDPSLPRDFTVFSVEKDKNGVRKELANIPLRDGDLLVMQPFFR